MTYDLFDPGHPQSIQLAEILIRRSAFDSGDKHRLIEAVIDFHNTLTDYGGYTRFELPAPLVQAYHVDYYDTQVKNGGHEQFVRNSRWDVRIVDDVDAGLVAMGAQAYSKIFKAVRALIDGDDRLKAGALARGGFETPGSGRPDATLGEYDKVFFARSRDVELRDFCQAWLRGLTIVRVVRDGEWLSELNQMILANPLRQARLNQLGHGERDFAATCFPQTEHEKQAYQQGAKLCASIGCELVKVKSAGLALGFGLLILQDALKGNGLKDFAEGPIVMGVLDTDQGELFVYSSRSASVLIDADRMVARERHPRSWFSRIFSG
jgi:hypothetical protein